MESVAVFPDGEWEVDFAQQVLQQFTFPDSVGLSFINTSPVCPVPVSDMTISGVNESLMFYNSQESSQSSNSSGSDFVSPTNHENFYVSNNHFAVTNDINMPLDISMDDKVSGLFPYIAMEDPTLNLIEDLSLGKLDASLQPAEELPINTKKRPRVAKDAMKVRKNQKISLHGNESTYSSEDDNVSQDGVANPDSKPSQALNLNGKARASRGSATDPQSLYARKRRERINERLRILQNLVPNGTKVDISTMLEEAVHYVKFLQLQIKILSSNDLWMYAPIAYNGIDISLNGKIATLL